MTTSSKPSNAYVESTFQLLVRLRMRGRTSKAGASTTRRLPTLWPGQRTLHRHCGRARGNSTLRRFPRSDHLNDLRTDALNPPSVHDVGSRCLRCPRHHAGGDGGSRTLTGGGLSALPLPIGLRPPGLCVCVLPDHKPRAAVRSGTRYAGPVPRSRLPHRALEHRLPPPSGAVPLIGYGLLVSGAIALSAWQARLTRDSSAAHWSVALMIAIAVVVTIVVGRGRRARPLGSGWTATCGVYGRGDRSRAPRSSRSSHGAS